MTLHFDTAKWLAQIFLYRGVLALEIFFVSTRCILPCTLLSPLLHPILSPYFQSQAKQALYVFVAASQYRFSVLAVT